jgi:hypothetical protein
MAQLRDTHAPSSAGQPAVALLCPEPRWRRILALVLEADGLAVLDWPVSGSPPDPTPAVIVADLDSLGWDAAQAIGRLAEVRLGAEIPLLLISVYPHPLEQLDHGRQVASLQPPFRWREFTRRVRCLLRASPTHPV